jgi:glycosyltransferase involved in cell wall biosynthesis
MATYNLSVSVFFPAHNEIDNIGPLTKKTVAVLSESLSDFEVLIINDGSTDGTREAADALAAAYPQVRAIHHDINRGYGGAVKTGIAACEKDWIFFTDGDGQFDITEINTLFGQVEGADAVVGYRIDRKDPFHRKVFAFCWGSLIQILFGFHVKDLDCAFKLFRRRYFDGIELKAEGALISVELFSILKKNKAKIRQVGVHHYPRQAGKQSGGNPKVVVRAFIELFKFYRTLKD